MTKQTLSSLFEYFEETCNQSIIRFYIKNHRKSLRAGFNVPRTIKKRNLMVSSSKRLRSVRKLKGKDSKVSFKALKGCLLDKALTTNCDMHLQ